MEYIGYFDITMSLNITVEPCFSQGRQNRILKKPKYKWMKRLFKGNEFEFEVEGCLRKEMSLNLRLQGVQVSSV